MLPHWHLATTVILIGAYSIHSIFVRGGTPPSMQLIIAALAAGVLIDLDRVLFAPPPRSLAPSDIIAHYISKTGCVYLQPLHTIELAIPLTLILAKRTDPLLIIAYLLHLLADLATVLYLYFKGAGILSDIFAKFSLLYHILLYKKCTNVD